MRRSFPTPPRRWSRPGPAGQHVSPAVAREDVVSRRRRSDGRCPTPPFSWSVLAAAVSHISTRTEVDDIGAAEGADDVVTREGVEGVGSPRSRESRRDRSSGPRHRPRSTVTASPWESGATGRSDSKPVENTEVPDRIETLSIRKPLPALAGAAVPLARKSSESTVRVVVDLAVAEVVFPARAGVGQGAVDVDPDDVVGRAILSTKFISMRMV